jgi:hypothetical protein
MFSTTLLSTLVSLAAALATPANPEARAPQPLPMPATVTGHATELVLNRLHASTLGASSRVAHQVTLREPGVLTVLVDGTGDLVLRVRNAEGEVICESDSDLDERLGREGASVRISMAGDYTVEIEEIAGEVSTFTLMASHTPFAPFHRDAPPPAPRIEAAPLAVNTTVIRTLTEAAADDAEYFVIVPERDGLLTIMTGVPSDAELDLMLEHFAGADFRSEALRSADDDLGGVLAQEAMTIAVRAGVPVHLRVAVLDGTAGARYRLVTELR